jgi:penicillin-binding protein 1A
MSDPDSPQSPIATQPAPVVPLRPGYGVPAPAPVRRRRRHGDDDGNGDGSGNGRPGGGGGGDDDGDGRRRVRIRKLRVFALLIGLGLLAAVSTVFGMMMAVASDLPALEQPATDNTVILDVKGRNIGVLTGNQKRIYLREDEIAPVMKHAIIAIEDRRFYTNEGVDLRGIGRALWQDVVAQKAVQGGSTITQQFVKNALAAQQQRTLFQKLREAALAYHLTRKWSKEQILRNYLNTIYFGNGAYGIESAARTYFSSAHPDCGDGSPHTCASQLTPGEAALIAGIVQNPSGFDPLAHADAAKRRRAVVLRNMLDQGFLIRSQYDAALQEPLPTPDTISPPQENTRYPYFTSWVKQQVVDRLGGGQQGARLAFEGGLRVRTTLDADMQDAAQKAVDQTLQNPDGPRAALVAIDNRTGAVRAMVGGDDYNSKPFNLATQGQRQPGSSIKPFILARALSDGISAGSTWESRKLVIDIPHSIEKFTVNNYANAYAGVSTLARALTFSDNSVFAQVGIKVGTRRVARLAERMGIRTPVSSNYAMTLGGLKEGVTALDMAHAYETLASGGKLVYGSLSPGVDNGPRDPVPGPVGIASIRRRNGSEWRPVKLPGGEPALNRTRTRRVLDPGIAGEVGSIMQSVVTVGSGTRAQVPGYTVSGKTGTTEAYGDAWFVGWAGDITVAVWVGYPDRFQPMKTEFNGEPVAGGTFPAAIFSTFMRAVLPQKVDTSTLAPTAPSTTGPSTTAPAAPSATPAPSTGGTAPAAPQTQQAPVAPAPAPPAAPAPPSGGGGGGTGGAGTGGGAAPPG